MEWWITRWHLGAAVAVADFSVHEQLLNLHQRFLGHLLPFASNEEEAAPTT